VDHPGGAAVDGDILVGGLVCVCVCVCGCVGMIGEGEAEALVVEVGDNGEVREFGGAVGGEGGVGGLCVCVCGCVCMCVFW
jgi:hypothetical protein